MMRFVPNSCRVALQCDANITNPLVPGSLVVKCSDKEGLNCQSITWHSAADKTNNNFFKISPNSRLHNTPEWAQNEIAVVPDFHKRILFSDEAHFWLNGYVNKQNCRIWSEANPQVYVETPLHPEKLTGTLYGLVESFFKNDEGHNVTVNGDRYRAMITNFFIPELNNHDVQELWFQQDGATCHTARATIDLLKDTFGDRLISRFGPVNWPPRSCDLTPLDYFLWGYVKSLVYADKPQTLWKTTFAVLLPIYGHKCWKKSSKIGRPDWITSEPAVAVLCQKSYLKCNATRLSLE
ncbi:uncharacterized protein TNCV_4427991 [Trichonephila clavipes]|nr:uncharacterized protein TNCV_4427991 [Trichonephila clavipes]